MTKPHAERAHSKFSASGAERWFNCPGSVKLSEGMPDKSSPWAIEGTQAHEVLEKMMLADLLDTPEARRECNELSSKSPHEMVVHAYNTAEFILELGKKNQAEVQVETRIYLDFIHPEMFGTFDGAVLDHFGTLHVFDFKYGAGHSVTPQENLQMIFYGIGLAHKHHWNFKRVRLWIIQPRIKGYDGPVFWDVSIDELYSYVTQFREAVHRVINKPSHFNEGGWCHWCKAKTVCPLKTSAKLEAAKIIFAKGPKNYGQEKGSEENKWLSKEGRKKALEKVFGEETARRLTKESLAEEIGDFW